MGNLNNTFGRKSAAYHIGGKCHENILRDSPHRVALSDSALSIIRFDRELQSRRKRHHNETSPMTVGITIKAKDGIVVACDSLVTFGRGVPVIRYTNKVHVIDHDGLESPVAIVGAGMSTFVDKFLSRAKREAITIAHKACDRKLDIVDFSERVAENVMAILFKEYVIDRQQFFGGAYTGDYSFSAMIAGATHTGELRAYNVHGMGLTEAIDECGTIGSGAAYAELFIRNLIPNPLATNVDDVASLAVYAVKGVEIMDPYVGGKTNVNILRMVNKKLEVKPLEQSKMPKHAKEEMQKVLTQLGSNMRSVIESKRRKRNGN